MKPRRGPAFLHSVAPGVFYPAFIILISACAVAALFPDGTAKVLGNVQTGIVDKFGWYYVLVVAGFVVFSLWMGLSRMGDITLGKDGEKPEFGLGAWFAMLFAAGMGIGLVFWGAAEPLTFFTSPKPGVEGSNADLAHAAMSQVFLHWGFHAWAIYVVVGLALAYSIHRKGRPVSIRWALEPLLGEKRVRGWLGNAIDTVAVVGTVAGVATSLGLGVQQVSAGLVHVGVFENPSKLLLVALIVIIMSLAIISAVSGVDKGIKYLSNANLIMAGIFLVAVLVLGETFFILREFVQNLGGYFGDVVSLSFDTSAFSGKKGQVWQSSWTTFYWGWWMSWAPFVGVFIARISRGRTVREFIAGVLLVPTFVTFLWFSVLGGQAIFRQMTDQSLVGPDGKIMSENVLFDMLEGLPGGVVLSVGAMILVTIFFVTSADSGSLVVDMLASGGDPNPPKWSRVLWAAMSGLVAIVLLLAGGLTALQTGAIITALPFSVVMIGMCVATYKALKKEHKMLLRGQNRQRQEQLQREIHGSVTTDLKGNFDEHFEEPVTKVIERV
ncbi:MAG: BCCT family transporter, partial [Allobranchiibius sp.]